MMTLFWVGVAYDYATYYFYSLRSKVCRQCV